MEHSTPGITTNLPLYLGPRTHEDMDYSEFIEYNLGTDATFSTGNVRGDQFFRGILKSSPHLAQRLVSRAFPNNVGSHITCGANQLLSRFTYLVCTYHVTVGIVSVLAVSLSA
jgi:hypothetical protein